MNPKLVYIEDMVREVIPDFRQNNLNLSINEKNEVIIHLVTVCYTEPEAWKYRLRLKIIQKLKLFGLINFYHYKLDIDIRKR